MRLAPLYDVASAWPYPRRIPVQKMKLAMQIGRHYRLKEVQPRHFEELAKSCRYPAETLIAVLKDLSERLPDEASALLREVEVRGMTHDVLAKLLDGLSAQCRATLRGL
jgi:serine/threonine-protein kinase HipA